MSEKPRINGGLAVASVLLSLMLWAVVYPQHLPAEKTRQLVAKVSYVGLPSSLIVTQQPTTLNVTATGPEEKLKAIDEDRLEFVVSLDKAKAGRNRYVATVTPPAYKDLFPTVESVPFVIEDLETKSMTVHVEPQGQLSDPVMAIDEYITDPSTVVASGPKSAIEELASAQVHFDLRDVQFGEANAKYVGVEPVLADGSVSALISIEPKVVKVTPTIAAAPVQKPVSISPQIGGSVADGFVMAGFSVSPNVATIRGPSRIVNSIIQLATDPIDIDGLTATKEFEVALRLPRGVTVTGKKTVKVRVLVNKSPEAASPP